MNIKSYRFPSATGVCEIATNAYTPENGEMMIFDHNCRITNNPDRTLEEIINKHCFKQLDEFRKTHP